MYKKLENRSGNTLEIDTLEKYLAEKDIIQKKEYLETINTTFINSSLTEQLGYLNLLNYYKLSIYKDLKKIFIEQQVVNEKVLKDIVEMLNEYLELDELFVFDMYMYKYKNINEL